MSKSYMCTNCLWTGTPDDMQGEGDELICPDCCAVFYPEDPERGPWEEVFPGYQDDEEAAKDF